MNSGMMAAYPTETSSASHHFDCIMLSQFATGLEKRLIAFATHGSLAGMYSKWIFAPILALFMAFSAWGAETFVQHEDPSAVCHNKDVILSIWQGQSLILSVDYNRKPAVLTVDGRRWLKLSSNIQTSIAFSAYCRLEATDGVGTLEVRDHGERLFGTVSRGRWQNRLTGETLGKP